ncbi:MAG: dihydrolipoamide dehydrogenase, partial [Bifidobacterium castoris]|nr:dihydrolipoamide dehydrogenase [Bifidobacterium castoris]
VWALGDITAGHALAHRAFAEGLVVAETIAGLDARPVNEDAIANIVFSSPEFATVGLTLHDAQADARYADVKETVFPVMSNPRMVMSGTGGSFSIVTGRDAERDGDEVVLGVHVVAPDASDMIAEAQQIVANHIPLHEAADAIHPHPTFSEMIGETLLKADGRPLHTR